MTGNFSDVSFYRRVSIPFFFPFYVLCVSSFRWRCSWSKWSPCSHLVTLLSLSLIRKLSYSTFSLANSSFSLSSSDVRLLSRSLREVSKSYGDVDEKRGYSLISPDTIPACSLSHNLVLLLSWEMCCIEVLIGQTTECCIWYRLDSKVINFEDIKQTMN